MIAPLELQRMAMRIERLQRVSTHGWGGDELDFRNRLPGGRDRRALPHPRRLQELVIKGTMPSESEYLMWNQTILQLESLAQSNDPRNPRMVIRNLMRGRYPY